MIEVQKTYRGKSANQILAGVEISIMQAGNAEITHKDFPGCIFTRDYDTLVVQPARGPAKRIECGPQALSKLYRASYEWRRRQNELNNTEAQ